MIPKININPIIPSFKKNDYSTAPQNTPSFGYMPKTAALADEFRKSATEDGETYIRKAFEKLNASATKSVKLQNQADPSGLLHNMSLMFKELKKGNGNSNYYLILKYNEGNSTPVQLKSKDELKATETIKKIKNVIKQESERIKKLGEYTDGDE